MRDLVRTLELIYCAVGLAAGLIVAGAAGWIARFWIHPQAMSETSAGRAIMLMGAALACLWPTALYSGGLMGLQRQVLLSVVNIIMYTVRFVGALPVLWLISPSIQAFFVWQAISGLAHVVVLAACLWRSLPSAGAPSSFRRALLASVWRFAAGLWIAGVLGTLANLADKAIVSKMATLEMFGYYSVAGLAAGVFARIFYAVFTALYPRFSQLAALNQTEELKLLYHRGSQVLAVILFPLTAVTFLFSKEILTAWTGNAAVAEHAGLALGFLALGTALSGMWSVAYGLQLAYGWVRLSLAACAAAVVVLPPVIYLLTIRYSLTGAAFSCVLMNLGFVGIVIPIMHLRLLRSEIWSWYAKGLALPILAALIVAVPARACFPAHLSRFSTILYLAAAAILAFVVASLVAPATRGIVFEYAGRCRKRENRDAV
jgi:O-antigen/teichoic acid export membrane protein